MVLDFWPTVADDTGTKTDGTILNKEFFDLIKNAVSLDISSGIVVARDIIEEVVEARGSESSLDDRLDTIEASIPSGAGATLAQVRSQVGSTNIAKNGELTRWPSGAAAAPGDWTLSGAGASVARTGSGEADTYSFLAGKYTLKLSSGGAANAVLTQTVLTDFSEHGNARGRIFTATCKCLANSGNTASLQVDDGVTSTAVSHPLDGAEHDLEVNHTINAAATTLTVKVIVSLGTHLAYFGGFQFTFAERANSDWTPGSGEATLTSPGIVTASTQEIGGLKSFGVPPIFKPGGSATFDALAMGKLHTNYVQVGNVGTGEDTLMSHTLAAATLNSDLRGLRIRCAGTFAANANNKQIKFFFGATSSTVLTAAAHNGGSWDIEVILGRRGATSQVYFYNFTKITAAGVVTNLIGTATPAETLSGTVLIKMTGEATANNDITQDFMLVEAF